MPKPRLRILVLEDHTDTRVALCRYLEMMGHSVRSAGSVSQARAILMEEEPQVFISDINLPDGDGWALLSGLTPHPLMYSIAISAYGQAEALAKSEQAGFRKHLLKPFCPDLLIAMLKEAAELWATEEREVAS
jgi:DNA-binding NtrC family response regulator